MNGSYINVVEKNSVAEIEFFTEKSNALNSVMLQELADEINLLGKKETLKVLVLKSKGDVFCAGAFFDELLAVKNSKEGELFFLGFAKVILAIKSCKAIVLTRLQGKAVGGAVGILAASDYVIASDLSLIKLSELSIGIGPFVISPVIKSKIGQGVFMHLALNPKNWFDPKWMLNHGLINEIVSTNDLNKAVNEKAEELSLYSFKALHELKKICNVDDLDSQMSELAKISGDLVTADETKKILNKLIKR